MTEGKIALAEGIVSAMAIYGRQYNPLLTLQALSYFEDLAESLPTTVVADLLAAVRNVSLQNLSKIIPSGKIGSGNERAKS
jgi:hypothetical protein